MPINFFQTINFVFTQGIAEICNYYGVSQDEAIQQTRNFLVANSAAYFSDTAKIKYDDPLCRMAYLYTYVGAHANLIDKALTRIQALNTFVLDKVNTNQELHICSLGGGPGSELLGVVKFIERHLQPNNCIDVHFTLIDRIKEWDESWQALVNGLESNFYSNYGSSRRGWPIVIHRSFLPLSLTCPQDFQNFPTRFGKVQVFVLNHTVSELLTASDDFRQVFSSIVKRASSGTYFLFIDRNQTEVVDIINGIVVQNNLKPLDIFTDQTNMDSDENKMALGNWYTLMGHSPKLKWNAYFIFAVK
jgi:hypothetical protein